MARNKTRICRKATKGKRMQWKKGQSSSSNPSCRKFRDLVKGRSLGQKGQSCLTEEVLNRHNIIHRQSDASVTCDDQHSIGVESFASEWSDCSNVCFDRLLKNWQSTSALHKEMLSVLAAVIEIIKSKEGKETETEYFAALLTALEGVETNESATAIITLLSMIIKRIPPSVLKIKFSDTSKVFVSYLEKYVDSIHHALVRGVINCLAVLLRVQEAVIWNLPLTSNIFNSILILTIHSKPKTRKAAQHAICSILKGSDITTQNEGAISHPAASITAKFCIRTIEENGGGKNATVTLHTLGLLKEILHVFPSSLLKASCEVMLKIMTLGNALVVSSSFQAFHNMFQNKPNSSNLPGELNAKIIIALYDYQPGINDAQLLSAWLTVMQKAFISLHRSDKRLFFGHLPKLFDVIMHCWISEKQDIHETVTTTLKTLLLDCMKPEIEEFESSNTGLSDHIRLVEKLFQSVEKGLKYQYHLAWRHVLDILTVFFDIFGKSFYSVMIKCLQSLADLRDSFNFSYTKELDRAIGKAITKMGPENVLQAIPLHLNIESDTLDFPRSWMLPVLRDNVRNTKLEFFNNYFLPLATKIKKKVNEYQTANRAIEAKVYSVIFSQIWSMLPGFCTFPTDFPQSFKGIAKILGTALTTCPELRLDILASLRLLIKNNLDNEASKSELSRYAKNFLPILFNLYTTEPKSGPEESIRLAVYDTIKIYLQIVDQELCTTLYQKAIEKLQEPDIMSFNRHSLLDISRALMPYISEDNVAVLYSYFNPLLQQSDRTVQKKSYRLLEELCQNETTGCRSFVNSHLSELKELLLSSLSSSSPSSKPPRLRCLKHVVQQLDKSNMDFLINIVPEAVFCVKETAEKVREAAYTLLVEVGQTFLRWNPEKPTEAIRNYMELLLAGLVGTPHFISATMLALGRVMFEFKDKIPSDVIHNVIENACTLLTSSNREIVHSTLSFIKSLFIALDPTDLAQHVEFMVKSLVTTISNESQRHLRFKVKEIFTRLVRKFGYEMIVKLIPDKHKKLLINIRKTEARKHRLKLAGGNIAIKKKNQTSENDIFSSDDDLDDNSKKIPHTQTWIEEESDEIVDFLGSSVSKKVLASKPTKKKEETEFKTAPDGRLIITEDADEEQSKKNKRKQSMDMEVIEGTEKIPLKRKRSDSGNDIEFGLEPEHDNAPSKGIYRKTDSQTSKKCEEYGKEYKAQKAGGDIKQKGKPDPYAYIKLNRKTLNKRKKAKISGQFKGIVKAAKRGAKKAKKRNHHKRNK